MYYVPLIVLTIFSLIEMLKKQRGKVLFWISFLYLLIILCLRYGQGSDYFGYMANYMYIDTHSEIGFRAIAEFFARIGWPFELFVALVSVVQMICISRAIILYSPYKSLSFLLMYPTVYLTYFFSGMRQGTVIAFFLGFMLKWLEKKQWLKYVIGCYVLATIHSAAIVLFVIPVVLLIKRKYLYWGIGLAVVAGVSICILPKSVFSGIKIGAVQYYIQSVSISYVGLLERIVMFCLITFLFLRLKGIEKNGYYRIEVLYKVYMYGFMVSLTFFPWSLLSSRLGVMMKAAEILLIPMLLKECKAWRKPVVAYLLCYVLLITTKNIVSYISQGAYEGYNVITYPYITVFNKELAQEIHCEIYDRILTGDFPDLRALGLIE